MKKVFYMLILLFCISSTGFSQLSFYDKDTYNGYFGDEELMEMKTFLRIDQQIKSVKMYIIDNDKFIECTDFTFYEDGYLTFYMFSYVDYYFVVNDTYDFTITAHSYEIVDERDLSISSNAKIDFVKDVLEIDFINQIVFEDEN